MSYKTEDRAIDNLLRARVGRQGRANSFCPQFDADLANAYVERAMTDGERLRYEQHICQCAPCRSAVVALSRMAEPDLAASGSPARAAAYGERAGWMATVKGWFAAPDALRWAAPVAAVLLLALSAPLLLSKRVSDNALVARPADLASAQSDAAAPAGAGLAASKEQVARAGLLADAKADSRRADSDAQAIAANKQQPDAQPAGPDAAPTAPPQTQNIEAGLPPSGGESVARAASEVQIAANPDAVPPPPAEERAELAKIDADAARRLPQSNEESAQMVVLKPGRIDGKAKTERETAATITPKDAIAPPPESPAAESRASRLLANSSPQQALRDSRPRLPNRGRGLPERRILKKRFWLANGLWVDKDYNPDKQLPEVSIIRASNVYNELLTKYPSLKPYFEGFAEGERVVVVYKGTVYKLVPPGAGN